MHWNHAGSGGLRLSGWGIIGDLQPALGLSAFMIERRRSCFGLSVLVGPRFLGLRVGRPPPSGFFQWERDKFEGEKAWVSPPSPGVVRLENIWVSFVGMRRDPPSPISTIGSSDPSSQRCVHYATTSILTYICMCRYGTQRCEFEVLKPVPNRLFVPPVPHFATRVIRLCLTKIENWSIVTGRLARIFEHLTTCNEHP
jgi:hypothetical protein